MKIAVVTGASSGLGREFVRVLTEKRPDLEEIWVLARRENLLEDLKSRFGEKIRALPMDLTDETAQNRYVNLLNQEKAEISLLINNAGFGKLGDFDKLSAADSSGMIRLNCEALTVFTAVSLPFMKENGEIINTCSIASFSPNARMSVYSATKAYVMSFSRSLRLELKSRKINVLAVCPGPMDTEFLPVAGIEKGTSKTFDLLPRVQTKKVALGSIKASGRKKGVYTPGFFYKFYRIVAKILPHSIVMRMSAT